MAAPYYKDGLKQLSAGSYGSWNDPVSELDSIEVLKGPASVYYGQGRPGGVVNVVTKKPEAAHVNSVGLSYGRYNRVEATADLGGAIDSDNKVLYRLNILGRDSDARTIDSRDDRIALLHPCCGTFPIKPASHCAPSIRRKEARRKPGGRACSSHRR